MTCVCSSALLERGRKPLETRQHLRGRMEGSLPGHRRSPFRVTWPGARGLLCCGAHLGRHPGVEAVDGHRSPDVQQDGHSGSARPRPGTNCERTQCRRAFQTCACPLNVSLWCMAADETRLTGGRQIHRARRHGGRPRRSHPGPALTTRPADAGRGRRTGPGQCAQVDSLGHHRLVPWRGGRSAGWSSAWTHHPAAAPAGER